MKYFLIAALLLSPDALAVAQLAPDEIKAKHAAYARCVENIEKDPHRAYEYCSDYLNKYPNHDKQSFGNLGGFIKAYKKIADYVKSVPTTRFTEITPKWAVYSPGLLATIPVEDSQRGKYRILIEREYGSPDEEKLLAKAESLYKNPEGVDRQLLKDWRFFEQPHVVLPAGEPKWWSGPFQTILATEIVTTEAVLYYYNTSQALRSNQGKLKENSFTFGSSNLKYKSSIKKMVVYERAGRSFKDVYVANMTLTWGQVCGVLCGFGFTRNKIVVMNASGEILEMFLDDRVNNSSWIS